MIIALLVSIAVSVFLFYKTRRIEELQSETIEYYINLSSKLAEELKLHKQLAKSLSHDLKSPLAGMISSAQALEMGASSLPSGYADCLRLMQISGKTNLRLLSNFIDLLGNSEKTGDNSFELPDNRLELVGRYLEPSLLSDNEIKWDKCDWRIRINLNQRTVANALAEILSLVASRNMTLRKTLTVNEYYDSEEKTLLLEIANVPSNILDEPRLLVAFRVLEIEDIAVSHILMPDGFCSLNLTIRVTDALQVSTLNSENPCVRADVLIAESIRQVSDASQILNSIEKLEEEAPSPVLLHQEYKS